MDFKVVTLKDRIDLIDQVASLDDRSWPIFLQNGDAKSWKHFYGELSDYVLVFEQNGKVIAAGFTVPVQWDGTIGDLPETIEAVLSRGLSVKRECKQPNTLIPIGALVDASQRGLGLSSVILQEMKQLANNLTISSLVVPVRPTLKAKYPLQSIISYASWRQVDQYLYDPWLRVHEKLGAEIIHISECTLTVKGSLSEWSHWSGMMFMESGQYIVPGALSAVEVNVDTNSAIYKEPNVWMLHPM